MPLDRRVRDALAPLRELLTDMGCHVEEAAPNLAGADEVFRVMRAVQMEASYGGLLDEHRALLKPDAIWNIEEGRRLDGTQIGRAELLRTAIHHQMREFFGRYDFLVAAVSQVPPFAVELTYPASIEDMPMADYLDWMRSCTAISVTGCPALSVPAAFTDDGLPVGLQIIGPSRADLAVLQMGHEVEAATDVGARRPPLSNPVPGCSAPRAHRSTDHKTPG